MMEPVSSSFVGLLMAATFVYVSRWTIFLGFSLSNLSLGHLFSCCLVTV